MEVDDSKEILKKENSQLSRRLAGSEKDAELKGEELRQLEEDSNRIETRRNEEKFRLEATLENFHQKYSDLEVKHKNSESLVKHLQEKLASHEAEKTDLEAKLTSLLTTIMRNFDQDVSKFRTRSHSFSRKGGKECWKLLKAQMPSRSLSNCLKIQFRNQIKISQMVKIAI